MKLKETYVIRKEADGIVLVDTSGEFSGLIRGNKTVEYIVNCLKENTTEEALLTELLNHFQVEEAVASKDLQKILKQLDEVGALV